MAQKQIEREESFPRIRKLILSHGGHIIQTYDQRYFTYELNGRFGHVCVDDLTSMIRLSSEYKPSKHNGTGAAYKEVLYSDVTIEDLMFASNYVIHGSSGVVFYKDIKDYLLHQYNFYDLEVVSANKREHAFKYLDGCYIFASENHAPTTSTDLNYLKSHYFNTRDEFRLIVQIKKGRLLYPVSCSNFDDKEKFNEIVDRFDPKLKE